MRGKKLGKAMVSNKHPNFLINLGGATARKLNPLESMLGKQFMRNIRSVGLGGNKGREI